MILDSHDRGVRVAVRPRVVLKYLGQLLLMLAGLTLVPLGLALVLHDHGFALDCGVVVLLLVCAIPLARLPAPHQIQVNEALTISALVFVIAPLVMSVPLAGKGVPFIDAWFEAVSGITTTGLSTLASVEARSGAFLFLRAWMQWYGGLGIAILSIALFLPHHLNAQRLMESTANDILPSTAGIHARRVLLVYLGMTLVGVLALWARLGDPLLAIDHALAAVSTGGFSDFDDSLGHLDKITQVVILLLSLAGAISLPLYYYAWRRGPGQLFRDPETLGLLVVTTVLVGTLTLLFAAGQSSWGEALQKALLVGVSAQTTTGFSSLDLTSLAPGALLVLILAMIIGGSTGSTAGGLKIMRLLILLRLLQVTIRRTAAPRHAVLQPQLHGERIENDDIIDAQLIVILFVATCLLSWIPFVILGEEPLPALFEVVSALGTVGLSVGIAGPDLAPSLKILLGFDMLFGRLEIIAILVLLYPGTWIGRRRSLQ